MEAQVKQGDIRAFRDRLAELDRAQRQRFNAGVPASELVRERAAAVDHMLIEAWAQFFGPSRCEGTAPTREGVAAQRRRSYDCREREGADLALVAVGGYGRGELHPGSDIDLMVLLGDDADRAALQVPLERFIAFLWDIGLEAGHSIRDLDECVQTAEADITVATTLMESRLLTGPQALYQAMRARTGPEQLWPGRAFFEAKLAEQQARHARYHDTAYKLEPNVKGSPGGLRDIQMIGWVAKRHFGVETLAELVDKGFLNRDEHDALIAGQDFLWQVRWALHTISGRCEDRLLMDTQLKLARMFGYEDAENTLAVEQFMQRYYRTIIDLSRLNDMLLQLFEEAILHDDATREPAPINPRFEEINGFIQVTDERVFEREPSAILEIFHLLQQNPHLKGVRAQTIRLLLNARHQVDEAFRRDEKNQQLFLAILREPVGITHELRRMNRYGILGRYLPAFGRVVGRMQYDLFHSYTVDEHTLFVVANLRRFALPRFDDEFPFASEIMQALPKPELAYLAGLFHDIAKGRGGDHSELGAQDAVEFCELHGLSRYDTRLVAWLVRHHLLLSMTAQKKDITDPQVIHDFAQEVGDQTHLDYLYVLTCADVRATNPELWNSWKAALFTDLYRQTRRTLRRGLENPIDKDELVAETREAALALLAERELDAGEVQPLWTSFTDEYFLLHTPDEIAWHTAALAGRSTPDEELVLVRQTTERGGTAVFLHTRHEAAAFSRATAALDQLGLTVLDARIIPDQQGRSLATYLVLEDTGEPIADRHRVEEIQRRLRTAMLRSDHRAAPARMRRPHRKIRVFNTPTQVTFTDDARNQRTVVEIITGDRPGLLAAIGKVFAENGVRVQNAKVTTIGERVEDVFFVTDEQGRPLADHALRESLEASLKDTLA